MEFDNWLLYDKQVVYGTKKQFDSICAFVFYTWGPFTQAMFVAQLDAIFVGPKLQPAAISWRF